MKEKDFTMDLQPGTTVVVERDFVETLVLDCARLRDELARAQGFREGHPGMCCGHCARNIAEAEDRAQTLQDAIRTYVTLWNEAATSEDNGGDVDEALVKLAALLPENKRGVKTVFP